MMAREALLHTPPLESQLLPPGPVFFQQAPNIAQQPAPQQVPNFLGGLPILLGPGIVVQPAPQQVPNGAQPPQGAQPAPQQVPNGAQPPQGAQPAPQQGPNGAQPPQGAQPGAVVNQQPVPQSLDQLGEKVERWIDNTLYFLHPCASRPSGWSQVASYASCVLGGLCVAGGFGVSGAFGPIVGPSLIAGGATTLVATPVATCVKANTDRCLPCIPGCC